MKWLGEYECHVDVDKETSGETLVSSVLTWWHFRVYLRIGHVRLQALSDQLDKARAIGDKKKAEMLTTDRRQAVEMLVRSAATGVYAALERRQKLLDGGLTVLFMASTWLYTYNSAGGVIIDALLVGLLWAVSYEFRNRRRYVLDIVSQKGMKICK